MSTNSTAAVTRKRAAKAAIALMINSARFSRFHLIRRARNSRAGIEKIVAYQMIDPTPSMKSSSERFGGSDGTRGYILPAGMPGMVGAFAYVPSAIEIAMIAAQVSTCRILLLAVTAQWCA